MKIFILAQHTEYLYPSQFGKVFFCFLEALLWWFSCKVTSGSPKFHTWSDCNYILCLPRSTELLVIGSPLWFESRMPSICWCIWTPGPQLVVLSEKVLWSGDCELWSALLWSCSLVSGYRERHKSHRVQHYSTSIHYHPRYGRLKPQPRHGSPLSSWWCQVLRVRTTAADTEHWYREVRLPLW